MAESVPSRLTCEQATALLLDYISGTLDPATVLLLERHLARCDDCAAFLQTYRKTIQATRTLCYDDMPEKLQNRLLDTLLAKIRGIPPQ